MLVEWGCKQADKDGFRACIEGMPDGLQLYKKFGFKEVGKFKMDLNPFGIDHEAVLVELLREPKEGLNGP